MLQTVASSSEQGMLHLQMPEEGVQTLNLQLPKGLRPTRAAVEHAGAAHPCMLDTPGRDGSTYLTPNTAVGHGLPFNGYAANYHFSEDRVISLNVSMATCTTSSNSMAVCSLLVNMPTAYGKLLL
jgi:hypothetical protein